MNPNNLIFAVCLIIQLQGNNQFGTATGFFFREGERTYLITNKHVVSYSTANQNPSLVLILHTNANDPSQTASLQIPLFAGKNRRWFQFDEPDIDVAVLPIENDVLSKFHIVPFSEADFPPSEIELSIGEELLAVGFPRGLYDRKNFTPLVRNCTIATPITVPFEGTPLMLIDGNLHRGMSGSPIVTKPLSTYKSKKERSVVVVPSPAAFLIGIHSFSIQKKVGETEEPVYEIKDGQVVIKELKKVPVMENLGLHSCWFNTVIIDLVKKIPK